MNLDEKIAFIESITNDLKKSVISKVDKMPANWNGKELRQFIADYYSINYVDASKLKGNELKEYKNSCIVNNIL